MILPVISPSLPDEMLLSWLARSAQLSGLSLDTVATSVFGVNKHDIQCDLRSLFLPIYSAMEIEISPGELFQKLSTYSFEAAWMSSGAQARYINNVFRPIGGINSAINLLLKDIKLCPMCVKEDIENYGRHYIHRSHQLSGVHACHKHGCMLQTFKPTEWRRKIEGNNEYKDWLKAEPVTASASEQAYAQYTHELLQLRIGSNSNIKTIRTALHKELKKRNYSVKDNYASLCKDCSSWKYADLAPRNISKFLRSSLISVASHVDPPTLIGLLMFLFPAPAELTRNIKKDEPTIFDATCPACGTRYCNTPHGRRCGFECPKCDSKLSPDEYLQKLISHTSPDYETHDHFTSLDSSITIRHKVCGQDVVIKPRAFLFEGVRCMCESTITPEQAKLAVSKAGNFELLHFTGSEKPVKIKSLSCGHTFTCRYRKFLKSPYCRTCFPKNLSPELFKEKVKTLTQGEYEVVGNYIDQNTRVSIRHTVCGTTRDYYPKHFISGQRCRACSKQTESWLQWLDLLAQYKREFGNVEVPKRFVYKGKALGVWLQQQRIVFNEGKLTSQQLQQLEDFGVEFSPLDAEWDRRFEQYLRYIKQNDGNPYIAKRAVFEGEHLGAWVQTQKLRLKQGKLSDDRLKRLSSVAPDFPKLS